MMGEVEQLIVSCGILQNVVARVTVHSNVKSSGPSYEMKGEALVAPRGVCCGHRGLSFSAPCCHSKDLRNCVL